MALREILAKFGFEVDSSKLNAAKSQLDVFTGGLKALPGIVGGVAGVLGLSALKDQVDEMAASAKELRVAAIKSGLGLGDFQRIQYQTGLRTDQLSGLFRKLQQNMAAAAGKADEASSDFQDADGGIGKALGKKQALETFKALNVQLEDGQGKALSSAQVFGDLTVALTKVKDPAQRTALAIRIFGRSGSDILPLLEKSPEAIAELGQQFDAFGGFTQEASDKLASYSKQQRAWKLAVQSVKIEIVTSLVPAFTSATKWLVELAASIKKTTDVGGLFKIAIFGITGAIIALNAASIGAAARTAVAWARAALPFVVLALVVDDLIHFFKGDAKTATEDLINAVFGLEAGKEIIDDLRAAVGQWISELTSATGWLEKIKVLIEGIGGAFDRIGSLVSGKILGKSPKDVLAEFRAAREGTPAGGLVPSFTVGAAPAIAEAKASNATQFISGLLSNFNPLAFLGGPPTIPGKPGAKGPQNNQVTSTINITQNITGEGAQEVADQAKEGVKGIVADQRRADLAALEARK